VALSTAGATIPASAILTKQAHAAIAVGDAVTAVAGAGVADKSGTTIIVHRTSDAMMGGAIRCGVAAIAVRIAVSGITGVPAAVIRSAAAVAVDNASDTCIIDAMRGIARTVTVPHTSNAGPASANARCTIAVRRTAIAGVIVAERRGIAAIAVGIADSHVTAAVTAVMRRTAAAIVVC
jgi:hypothetical protein